jgi:hypothetical protein
MSETTNLPGFEFSIAENKRGFATKQRFLKKDGSTKVIPYDRGWKWKFTRFHISNFEKMKSFLAGQINQPRQMMVFGELMDGFNPEEEHRRLWASKRGENTLHCPPRWFIVIDADKVLLPENLRGVANIKAAAEWIRDNKLPSCVAGARCLAMPSSSAGWNVEKLSLHYFFLLESPVELEVAHRWAFGATVTGLSVDFSLFRPGQPIFIAKPLLHNLLDPVPSHLRLFELSGRERIDPNWAEFETATRKAERTIAAVKDRVGDTGWRIFLEETLGGPTGYFLPLSQGLGMAAPVEPDDEIIKEFALHLLAERADEQRIKDYDEAWLQRNLDRFRDRDNTRLNEIAAALDKIFLPELATDGIY